MSSHVVVLDSTARRATIKTTPGKYLTDILQEACKKLGLNPTQYGLKYKSKELDLSLAFRLSGLSPGAKLELVQLSRSPSVVTVALQLPPSEARDAPNGRLMDKFPSTTSIWMLLRKFEAGVAGSQALRNLTGRGTPVTDGQGSGRLFYETPVVQVLDRELSTLPDFQKSLAQLGFNSGNVLVRLSFRRTDQPLEDAMTYIHEFFKSEEDETKASETPTSSTETGKDKENAPPAPQETEPASHPTPEDSTNQQPTETPSEPALSAPSQQSEPSTDSSRPVTVYAPPSSATPQSAQTAYNEADYVPSVEHAQVHQRQLQAASKNIRLKSDAELSAAATAEEERRAAVKEVDVKIRLPDQSQIVSKFGQQDTGQTLYGFVRSCLAPPYAKEKFVLTNFSGPSASKTHQQHVPFQSVLSDSDKGLLIKNHGMTGRVLVNFSWDTSASPAAQKSRSGILRPELQTKAQEHKVEQPPDVMDTSGDVAVPLRSGDTTKQDGDKARKIPKWLKLPGKK